MKKHNFGVGFSRSRYHLINGNSKERKRAYHDIKEQLCFSDLCDSIDYIKKNVHSHQQELIWGKALPNSYSELGDLREIPYVSSLVNAELNLCLIGLRKYKYEVNLFLKYKEQYEIYLLTGEYDKADEILTKIETDICFSLWTLENRFVLKEISGKAPENKEFLSDFNQVNRSKGITKYLAHYLSLRAEHSLSVSKYLNDVEMSLSGISDTEMGQAFKNYYKFKLTFLNHIDFEHYGEIISIEFSHSIIDRYINLVKILTNLLAVSSYFQDQDENKKALKSYLQNRINYLLRKIDDPILYKLKLLSGEAIFPAFNTRESEREIRAIDNYTIGLYSESEKEFASLLLDKPIQFDLYVLYVKSLIFQKKKFTPVGNAKSLQNEILSDLYKIISVTVNTDQASLNLLRIANNIASCQLSYGITDFVYFQSQGRNERRLLSRLSYNIANPIIYNVFESNNDKEKFLNILGVKFPKSITIQFFSDKIKGADYLKKYEQQIPIGKFKIEYASKLQEENNYLHASPIWEELIQDYKEITPIWEIAIIELFKCYYQLNKIDKCIDLYVDSFFTNNHIVDKVETGLLLDKIKSDKFRNVSKTINLPIFYTIVDADEVETHIALELYNSSMNVNKPSQLLSELDCVNNERVKYFFEYTCSPKILRHSIYIENSKERLEERLSILNYLKDINAENKNILSEIKSIENILVIQQGLIDLDESKIYVNEQGIIDNELQDFEAIYERFEVISGISSGDKKLFMLKGGKLTAYASQENSEIEVIEYSNNPVFDIYHELFNAVKDKFLNSQFGIVAYLSTRIRHGVLVGEIRPIFETHNLITLKEGNSSSYRRNYFWDIVYDRTSPEKKEQIQILLNDFASKIDSVIFDLIKKNLQVYKKDSNEDGWFNYEFDPNALWLHSVASITSTSFEDFVMRIIDVLWQRTDENLEHIRYEINNSILGKFNGYFDELERSVRVILDDSSSQPLIKAIKDCSTEIQIVIQKISRWFKRSEIKASDFNLSELINLVVEYTNKSSLHKRLLVSKNINYDCKIKGQYKIHFADLIRIFLENILKHANESVHEINCEISSIIEGGEILRIVIKNEITDEGSLESLKSIWKNNKPDTTKLLSEGKSGYHKAYKILTSDLRGAGSNSLGTDISEDEKYFSVTLNINIKELMS